MGIFLLQIPAEDSVLIVYFKVTPNIDCKAEFRFAESRCSQLLYH